MILAGLAGSYDSELAYGEVVEVVREQAAGIPDRYAESYAVEPLTELRTVRSLTVDRSGGGTEFAAKASAQVENMEEPPSSPSATRWGGVRRAARHIEPRGRALRNLAHRGGTGKPDRDFNTNRIRIKS